MGNFPDSYFQIFKSTHSQIKVTILSVLHLNKNLYLKLKTNES